MAVIVVGAATAEGKLVSAASAGAQSTNGVNKYSAGIADVLKMVDAGVSKDVIKTYIENSPVAYRPSADEIIALHERGVSGEIITALLHRGAEVRAKLAQAMQASQSPPVRSAPQATGSYAPAANYAPAPQLVYQDYSYAYSYPAYSYVDYPSYSYVSPYFYSSFGYYPYFSYRNCHPYYGYRSCYPRYSSRSCYSPYSYRGNYRNYSSAACPPRYGGFHASYSSTRYAGGVSPNRHAGFRAGHASARYSGGFAASRPGGFNAGVSSRRLSGGFASVHHGGGSSGRRR